MIEVASGLLQITTSICSRLGGGYSNEDLS